jgi:hypothetical protein
MALEIRQIRHVFVLVELGSFARSAAVLHLSQSALSRSIQMVWYRRRHWPASRLPCLSPAMPHRHRRSGNPLVR